MYCQACGAELEKGAKFCPACGHEVGKETTNASPQTATPSPAPAQAAAPAKKRRWPKVLAWIGAGFVAFVVLVVVLSLWATSGVVEPVERHFEALRNGDMITAVNEYALSSMDDAMTAYSKLRDASELDLAIERKGERFALKITITE